MSYPSIQEIGDEIVEEFSWFSSWEEKYEHLIEMGRQLPIIDEAYKTDDRLVRGCQSRVWLHAESEDQRVVFRADSDAIITKGIVALLVRALSHQPAEDIVRSDLSFIDTIGLKAHLSPTRSNGLVSMIQQMKQYAGSQLNH